MPLGFERLNERQQRPNQYINFIKPLEGPDKATAEEFLSRIAAQCYPVMKKHHISVMALEEYAPNPEFLGRNFNAGEIIQLVLKDKAGRWLSMKFVQMVMMHELAHCKQMNHSRFFWNVRNEYAKQMEELWREKYMGEGMWGRGRGLATGGFVNAAPPDQTLIPEHLCGGSYRRRGRKRKRGAQGDEEKAKLSYAERQQQRIQRKFGKHGEGQDLGEDELVRGALSTMNGGKRAAGKPRVANSKRGRDLRANAALLRFEAAKNQQKKEQTPDLVEDLDSETDSEWEMESAAGSEDKSVVISDGHGHDLVKVCGDGEDDEDGAGREMDELRMLSGGSRSTKAPAKNKHVVDLDAETESEAEEVPSTSKAKSSTAGRLSKSAAPARGEEGHEDTETEDESDAERTEQTDKTSMPDETTTSLSTNEAELLREVDRSNAASLPDEAAPLSVCPICSLENAPESVTCIACSNVLRPKLMPNHWRCKSDTCKGSAYTNAGDAGRCGICGIQKPKPALSSAATERPMGITRAEVLRWD
ncbi:DNA-dependent metalloprotease WSS1-like [Pseudocercospora fuligena]|uniref:DNA-dependent metalloprotease WSS1-like n=1 Tax=Pseudocercospora fuligena TaxID=685502 RepID=A0A8H6VLV2_9PEZI|nr:DNA-dependent metalloprotease WSS1-like [Pseudocercospora fuligena]